jgi:hypothetical protein
VAQDVSDVNHPPSVFDGSNQSASIIAYIKNYESSYHIGILPTAPNLRKVFPVRILRDLVPSP